MKIKYVEPSKPILVMGYDWEKYGKSSNIEQNKKDVEDSITGIQTIFRSHEKYNAPFTLFALGRVLEKPEQVENCSNLIKKTKVGPIVDIQQHAYSHTPFIKLPSKDISLSIDEAIQEVLKTKELIKNAFGRECIGIRPPYGHFEGLQRDPELVSGLIKHGIKFISSDLRNKDDQFPPDWNDKFGRIRQPYWYTFDNGYVLEIPTNGNSDNLYRGVSKYVDTVALNSEEILEIHIDNLKKALKENLIYVPLFHVWVVGRFDDDGIVISGLLDFAIKNNIEILSYYNLFKLLSQ